MEINTLIVDDEPLALDVLETYIQRMPELKLITRCANAFQANEALTSNSIDLMFLDIQMPQLTGIDFIKTLKNPPLVIFTTAFPNYAIEGFELDAVDYLLKPISADRFMKAANKAIEQIKLRQAKQGAEIGPDESEFIFVKADKKYVKVRYDEIIYIEGLKDYVIIKLLTGRVITLQTMKSLEDKLPSKSFKRIHRSYIVNLDKINAIVGNMVDVLENGKSKHLPVGKNYRDDLLDMVQRNKL
ncbi:MAG: response regulator transcription factor [Saprospiraceae bacterium]|nr:response regulator transcription factor [Saprospiraceae bacterium]